MTTFRLVLCVDVEAENLDEAYETTYDKMSSLSSPDFEWESSDEAYGEGGEQINEDDLQAARMRGLEKKEQ